MTTMIRTEANAIHVHIITTTIAEMLNQLDRTRRALCALDDRDPRTPADYDPVISAAQVDTLAGAPGAREPGSPNGAGREAAPEPANAESTNAGETPLPADIPLSLEEEPDDNGGCPGGALADLQQEIATVGAQLFGPQWPKAAVWLVENWTYKHTPFNERSALDQLDADECTAVLSGMVEHAPALQAEWQKHLHNKKAQATQAAQQAATKSAPRKSARAANNGAVVRERF